MLKRRLSSIALALLLVFILNTSADAVILSDVQVEKPVKNVILLIPDGMNVSSVTLARWYNGGELLNMDSLASGLVRTYSSDAAIADSAPAGTAMATGFKSHTGFIGVLADKNTMPGQPTLNKDDQRKPVATILEAAQLEGKSTGIVSTSEIMHATPADFTAHFPNRKNYDDISEQQVYQNLDVVLGAGSKFFTKEARKDKEDLIEVIKSKYNYVTTPADMKAVKEGKIFGLFAEQALAYDFDRDPSKEPALAEMTQKAIELLSKNDKGFFLMVEGSKIDWAAHANDPIGIVSDVLAFDKAVGVAMDYARKSGDTLVIAASDHVTGGLSIGDAATSRNYDILPLSNFIDPLKKASLTGEGLESKLNDDKSNIAEVLKKYYGIDDLSEEELNAIKEAKSGSLNYIVGPMISKRANLGWTTNGHTGEEITLFVYAPKGVDQLTGTVENSDIAIYMEKAMGVNLSKASEKLFVLSRPAFEAKGAKVEFDNKTDSKNPVLVVTKGSDLIMLPINKNIAILNGKEIMLDGVVVFNGINTYVPQSAIELLK